MRRDEGLVLLVGNTGAETIYVPVQFADENLLPRRAAVRVYNSERRSWESLEAVERSELSARPLLDRARRFSAAGSYGGRRVKSDTLRSTTVYCDNT